MADLVVDCPKTGQSVAPDGLVQYLQENVQALDEEKQEVERLQGASFGGGELLEQASFEGEVSPERGSLQSLGKSCGRVS